MRKVSKTVDAIISRNNACHPPKRWVIWFSVECKLTQSNFCTKWCLLGARYYVKQACWKQQITAQECKCCPNLCIDLPMYSLPKLYFVGTANIWKHPVLQHTFEKHFEKISEANTLCFKTILKIKEPFNICQHRGTFHKLRNLFYRIQIVMHMSRLEWLQTKFAQSHMSERISIWDF